MLEEKEKLEGRETSEEGRKGTQRELVEMGKQQSRRRRGTGEVEGAQHSTAQRGAVLRRTGLGRAGGGGVHVRSSLEQQAKTLCSEVKCMYRSGLWVPRVQGTRAASTR